MVGCLGFQEQIVLFVCVRCLVFMVTFVHYQVLFFHGLFFCSHFFDSTFSHNLFARNTHRNPLTIFKERRKAQLPSKNGQQEKKNIHFLLKPSELYVPFFPKKKQRCEADMISFSICLGAEISICIFFKQKPRRLFPLGFFVVRLIRMDSKRLKNWDKIVCERERFQVVISSVYFQWDIKIVFGT